MKKTTIFAILFIFTLLLCSCSHNPAAVVMGRQLKVGTAEYGELTYLNGFSIVDCARENSEWQIDINDADGISFDAATHTLKGVKSIRRRIGKQVTGYLNDLAKNSPDAAMEYLKGDVMFPVGTQNIVEVKEDATLKAIVESKVKSECSKAEEKSDKPYAAKYITCKAGDVCEYDFKNRRGTDEQLAIAKELRDFDFIDKDEKRPDEYTHTKYENVIDFIARTEVVKYFGVEEVKLWISYVKINAYNKLEAITFLLQLDDGEIIDETCVSCAGMPEIF